MRRIPASCLTWEAACLQQHTTFYGIPKGHWINCVSEVKMKICWQLLKRGASPGKRSEPWRLDWLRPWGQIKVQLAAVQRL
jgi:hypothetical protein